MLKTLLIIAAVVGVIGAAGVAWAKYTGYCPVGDRMQYITDRMSRKLDLNDEQRDRLQAFVETLRDLREERQDLRGAMQAEVADLLAAPQLDRDRAVEAIDARVQSMTANKHQVIDAFAEFSDSLAPEQRTRLAALIGERLAHRWGHPRWTH